MQLYPGMSSDRKLVHAFACDDQPDVNQGQYVGYKPFDSRSVGVEITSDKKSRTHFFCRSISVLRPSVEMPEAIVQRDGDNAQCVRNTVQFFYQLSVATVQCDGTVSIADTQLFVDEGG